MPLNTRDDILTFETEPLTEDLEMSGHVWVELYVSTDAPDTDFTAKLIDQYPTSTEYPDGYAMLLTDSITRLRYRDSIEHVTPYTPGEVVKVRINVRIVSNVFKAGHRIRLDISSSNFPSFDPNPNTGEPIGKHTHQRLAHNTIHLGGQHPSKLTLPVRPVG
jgi:putative CocE/NonD family hydrolase